MDARLSAMETLLEEKKDEVQDLTAQLEECKDYAELKQELQVMKSIEFSASSNPHSIKDKSLEVGVTKVCVCVIVGVLCGL